ncbi:MAG: anthranilate synthase component I, partial [Dehalococcoidia bacterium]|nr:anthranilate synthase component I [Dehalococcoidia bacterium]
MYTPSRDAFRARAEPGTIIPVYRDVLADLETPVSAYLKVARGDYSFLLESVEGGER